MACIHFDIKIASLGPNGLVIESMIDQFAEKKLADLPAPDFSQFVPSSSSSVPCLDDFAVALSSPSVNPPSAPQPLPAVQPPKSSKPRSLKRKRKLIVVLKYSVKKRVKIAEESSEELSGDPA